MYIYVQIYVKVSILVGSTLKQATCERAAGRKCTYREAANLLMEDEQGPCLNKAAVYSKLLCMGRAFCLTPPRILGQTARNALSLVAGRSL